jgi:hypothetical protein
LDAQVLGATRNIKSTSRRRTPNNSGDTHWIGKGDVIKGEWKHIEQNSWKAGYQWAIKTQSLIDKMLLENEALPPFKAADEWGRGRNVEYPEYFGPRDPSEEPAKGGEDFWKRKQQSEKVVTGGHNLANAGYQHNKLERPNAQVTGADEQQNKPKNRR